MQFQNRKKSKYFKMLERDSKRDIIANKPLHTLCLPSWYIIIYEQKGLEVYFLTIINPLLIISYFVGHPVTQSHLFTEQFYLFTELCLKNRMLVGVFCALRPTYKCVTPQLDSCYWFPTLFIISFMLFVFTLILSAERCSVYHCLLGLWLPSIFT